MSQPQVQQIDLGKLPVPAVELILGALAELPYKVSGGLIAHIQATARAQVAAAAAAPAADEAAKAGDQPAAEVPPQSAEG